MDRYRRIDELYKERDTLSRWLIVACIFFFIPGIALGLAIQIKTVDGKIRKEIEYLKQTEGIPEVVLYAPLNTEKEETKS